MELKIIVLSKISHAHKYKYCMLSLLFRIQKENIDGNLKAEKE